jgi:hypothetical protein
MAPLSWRHHTLLQALLTRGPLSERDFHAVFAAVSGKNPGKPPAQLLSSLYASYIKCSTKCSCALPAWAAAPARLLGRAGGSSTLSGGSKGSLGWGWGKRVVDMGWGPALCYCSAGGMQRQAAAYSASHSAAPFSFQSTQRNGQPIFHCIYSAGSLGFSQSIC